MLGKSTEFHEVWRQFVSNGSTELVPSHILQSWIRCRDLGVDYKLPKAPLTISGNSLEERITENDAARMLFHYHSGNISEFCKDISCITFFADSEGYITDISGDDDVMLRFESSGLTGGTNIKESYIGTSAPGLTLIKNSYSVVVAEEHYCEVLHQYSCISAPIYNDNRDLVGIIDLSVLAENSDKLKLLIPFIINLANSIHLELSLKELLEKHSLYDSYFHSNFEYSRNNLLLVNPEGKVISMNRKAQEYFRIYPEKIRDTDLGLILGCDRDIKPCCENPARRLF